MGRVMPPKVINNPDGTTTITPRPGSISTKNTNRTGGQPNGSGRNKNEKPKGGEEHTIKPKGGPLRGRR